MPDGAVIEHKVTADLQVVDGGASRLLNTQDLSAASTGAAREDTALLLASLLDQIRAGQGTVALDGPTLAALTHVVVSGNVALDAPTLAALEQITVSGVVSLDSTTVTALKTVTAAVSGTVALDSATIAAIKPKDTQPVSGTVAISNPPASPETGLAKDATLKDGSQKVQVTNLPVTQSVSGTVAVSNPTASPETGLAKDATLTGGSQKTQVTNFPASQPVSASSLPLPAGAAKDSSLTDGSQRVGGTVAVSATALPLPAGAAATSDVQAVRDRLPSSLDTDGALKVADVFTGGEVLPDQSGDGTTVRTFTFSAPVDLVWVRAFGGGRADPFGGTPTLNLGIPCAADEPNPMTVRTTTVRVIAATGTISVWGYRG